MAPASASSSTSFSSVEPVPTALLAMAPASASSSTSFSSKELVPTALLAMSPANALMLGSEAVAGALDAGFLGGFPFPPLAYNGFDLPFFGKDVGLLGAALSVAMNRSIWTSSAPDGIFWAGFCWNNSAWLRRSFSSAELVPTALLAMAPASASSTSFSSAEIDVPTALLAMAPASASSSTSFSSAEPVPTALLAMAPANVVVPPSTSSPDDTVNPLSEEDASSTFSLSAILFTRLPSLALGSAPGVDPREEPPPELELFSSPKKRNRFSPPPGIARHGRGIGRRGISIIFSSSCVDIGLLASSSLSG